MSIDDVYQFFIPYDIKKDDIAYSAAKNQINTCLISLVASFFYAQLYYFLHFEQAVIAFALTEAVMFSSLFILKYFHSLELAVHLMVLSMTAVFIWLIYHLGGIASPVTYWLILPGMVAAFVGGIRAGIVWCLINVAAGMCFYTMHIISYPLPTPPVTNLILLEFISFSGLAMLVVMLIYIYEADKFTSLNKFKDYAYKDGLTQLPNRRAYERILENAIYKANSQSSTFTVFLIDVDNFRRVNESFGESYGNILLQEIVHRIKNNIVNTELIAKVSGDQFKIIIEAMTDHKAIREIAECLLGALKIPYYINNNEINITVSVSIAIYTPRKVSEQHIDRYVELAMLKAKKLGGDNFQFYTSELATEEASRIEIERSLPNAIANNEIELYFQPLFEAKNSKKITGIEALLRWHSKTLGDVPPRVFIPIAEKIGYIVPLGDWVLFEACQKYMTWFKSGKIQESISLAINISPIQLHRKDFIDTVRQVLVETGIPPERLEFELTETAIVTSESDLIDVLERLRKMGICTLIDDFGSGSTSLSYLTTLPVTGLKIDKVFMDKMLTTVPSADIVESIINLAHKINLKVIAEGVESSGQLDYLVNLNCDIVQGFYLSRPLKADDLVRLLEKHQMMS